MSYSPTRLKDEKVMNSRRERLNGDELQRRAVNLRGGREGGGWGRGGAETLVVQQVQVRVWIRRRHENEDVPEEVWGFGKAGFLLGASVTSPCGHEAAAGP